MTKAKTFAKRTNTDEPKPVVWDLYRDGVTQGFIETFLTCRHHAFMKYVLGWKPRDMGTAIEFGLAFHDMADLIVTKRIKPALAKEKYVKHRMAQMPTDPASVEACACQALAVIQPYFAWWAEHDKKYTFLSREEEFCVPYNVKYDYQYNLRGKFDGVIEIKDGKKIHLGLYECKTKGRIDEQGIEETLQFDVQTLLYLLAIRLKYGRTPTRLIYDVIRQPQLRQGKEETLQNYCSRISHDVENRPEEYFYRWNETITTETVDKWCREFLDKVIHQINLWFLDTTDDIDGVLYPQADPFRSNYHYRNSKALLGLFGGRKSEYFAAMTRGDYSGLYRSANPYPELSPSK